MANKDLFKQAIADAKSIREAAIANAKLALEESLTPQLKELLAQRLAEMEEDETEKEEVLDETIGPDGLVAVSEAEEEGEGEDIDAGEEEDIDMEAGDEEEAEDDSEESEDEAGEKEEVGEMTPEELKNVIRDVLMQVLGDQEAGREDDLEAGAEEMGAEDMTAVDDTEINIEEIMAELAEINNPNPGHGNIANETADPLAEAAVNELMGHLSADVKETVGAFAEGRGMSIQEVMKEMAKYGSARDMKEVAKMLEAAYGLGEAACNAVMERLITTPMTSAPAMEEGIMDKVKGMSEDMLMKLFGVRTVGELMDAIANANKINEGGVNAGLSEALATIETLRSEINETNLLNAKLLYVNKVFKANNLTENQKASIIAAFDKAETVKEVKLVYETVSENVATVGKKEVVKEAKGFASAATGISTKPAVITEANAAVLRMQKLAGIIK